jgi:hypothetical protein
MMYSHDMGEKVAIAIFLLLFIFGPIFALAGWILFRNVALTGARRLAFAISAGPLFFALMFVNLWLVSRWLPSLLEEAEAHRHDGPLGHEDGVPASFLVSAPLALLGCYLWYRLLKLFEKTPAEGKTP